MPPRTRTAPAESTPAEGDAAPDAEQAAPEQAAPEQPADEAQTTPVTTVEQTTPADLRDRLDEARHDDLTGRLDALAAEVTLLRENSRPDLGEVHDRFDLLTDEIGGLAPVAPSRAAPAVLGQVLAVMRQVDEIGKGGTAPAQMGGYKFRKVDDAIDAVGGAVRQVGLVLRSEVAEVHTFPRKVSGSSGPRDGWGCRVTMRYVFVSPEDGSEHAIEGVGEGADAGDKATSKATSMALKYALLQGLMIPVEGAHLDAEAEDTRPQDTPRGGGRRDDRQPPPRDDRRDQRPPQDGQRQGATSQDDPPEVRAAEVLRRANDGRPADAVQALLGRAGEAGLLGVEIDSYGERATLQQHMLAVIRLARRGQGQ